MRRLVPNALTSIRLAMSLGVLIVLPAPEKTQWVALLGACTDFLDGHLARRWGEESAFGASFDLFSDGTFFLAFSLMFWWHGTIPTWLLGALLSSSAPELAALVLLTKAGAKVGSPGRFWNRLSGGYAYCCIVLVGFGWPAVSLVAGQSALAWFANLADLRLAWSIPGHSGSTADTGSDS